MHVTVRIDVWKQTTRAPCRGSGEATPRFGRKRSPAIKIARRRSENAHAAARQCASCGNGGRFRGDGPEYQPNNAKCGCKRFGGSFPAPRTVRRVPPNASRIATLRLYHAPRPTWPPLICFMSSRWRGAETSS